MSFFFIDDASAVNSSSYVAPASSTGATITIPASAQAGDVAVLYDVAGSSVTPSLVTPPGWLNRVNRVNTDLSNTRLAVHTKILSSGDPGSVITGMSGDSRNDKIMVVFRPDAVISNMAASAFTDEFTNSAPSSQIIAASGASPPIIVLGGCGVYNATAAFSTASPAFDAQIASTNGRLRIGYKLYNAGSTPADHTIGMNDLGSGNSLWGGYLTLT